MEKIKQRNWLYIVKGRFDHPAVVLWRAVELKHIERILNNNYLKEPVLDLGCAEGNIADILFKDKSLIGLDNCWELLNKNRETDIYKALVLADGCAMPFKNAAFGSVFSNCVIEHIPDLDEVLSEVSRVMNGKGLFLFTVPSHRFTDFLFFSTIFDSMGLKRLSNWYEIKRNKLLNHYHCYDHSRWMDILKSKGFNLIKYEYYMSKKATYVWDFLAASVFILRTLWPLNYLLPKINRWLSNNLNKYYNMDSDVGSGLLLVAQKI